MHTIGPNTSRQPTFIESSIDASSTGGSTAPLRAPPARRLAPFATASSTQLSTRIASFSLMSGPTTVSGLTGSPNGSACTSFARRD